MYVCMCVGVQVCVYVHVCACGVMCVCMYWQYFVWGYLVLRCVSDRLYEEAKLAKLINKTLTL